ncbi:hypothetical protein EVAR_32171_1 [Eumeta japonica]|uniref:Uncharacterized protein n=1 Tax=Eumeta variegata TaxID=151549 RepID=A0A4C1W0L3_EUMVA|nr:hypothetical protein EVAR_32171_1 [Eumeta japonica]
MLSENAGVPPTPPPAPRAGPHDKDLDYDFSHVTVLLLSRVDCVRPLSLFYSDASVDGVEGRSLFPRSRSHAWRRRNVTGGARSRDNLKLRARFIIRLAPLPPRRPRAGPLKAPDTGCRPPAEGRVAAPAPDRHDAHYDHYTTRHCDRAEAAGGRQPSRRQLTTVAHANIWLIAILITINLQAAKVPHRPHSITLCSSIPLHLKSKNLDLKPRTPAPCGVETVNGGDRSPSDQKATRRLLDPNRSRDVYLPDASWGIFMSATRRGQTEKVVLKRERFHASLSPRFCTPGLTLIC